MHIYIYIHPHIERMCVCVHECVIVCVQMCGRVCKCAGVCVTVRAVESRKDIVCITYIFIFVITYIHIRTHLHIQREGIECV